VGAVDGEELVLVGFRFAWRFAQGRVIRRLFEALARRASQDSGTGGAHYRDFEGLCASRVARRALGTERPCARRPGAGVIAEYLCVLGTSGTAA